MPKKNQLRIISGQWRGRKLPIADIDGLRPTGDRVRETLFNWLMSDIPNSHCLDLFSGSGALGTECLSRGASSAIMIESNPQAAKQIKHNCKELNAESASIIQQDCIRWLQNKPGPRSSIDIVFIDPPFSLNLWQTCIENLLSSDILKDKALIYIETPKNDKLIIPAALTLLKDKASGEVRYRLYEYQSTGALSDQTANSLPAGSEK